MSATLIPSVPSGLTGGENRVLERLAACYESADGVFIYIQPRIRNMEPDFIVIDPSRGIAVFEVKDWTIERIASLTRMTVTFSDGEEDQNPAFKTNRYFDLVKGVLEADRALYDETGAFVPKLSARLIMSRLSENALQQIHDNLNLFPCKPLPSASIAEMTLRDIFGENAHAAARGRDRPLSLRGRCGPFAPLCPQAMARLRTPPRKHRDSPPGPCPRRSAEYPQAYP